MGSLIPDFEVIAVLLQATHAAYKLHLKQLLDEYDLACLLLQTVETEIIAVLERIPFAESMLAVKGISAISQAGILDFVLLSALIDTFQASPIIRRAVR